MIEQVTEMAISSQFFKAGSGQTEQNAIDVDILITITGIEFHGQLFSSVLDLPETLIDGCLVDVDVMPLQVMQRV